MKNEKQKSALSIDSSDQKYEFFRLPKVMAMTGLSKTTIWDLSSNDPDFPKPVKILPQVTAWRSDELQIWMDSRPRANLSRQEKKGIK